MYMRIIQGGSMSLAQFAPKKGFSRLLGQE
jgi:hypothetical protein